MTCRNTLELELTTDQSVNTFTDHIDLAIHRLQELKKNPGDSTRTVCISISTTSE